jgi:hypothetical protein
MVALVCLGVALQDWPTKPVEMIWLNAAIKAGWVSVFCGSIAQEWIEKRKFHIMRMQLTIKKARTEMGHVTRKDVD